jgi:hypothetical protein
MFRTLFDAPKRVHVLIMGGGEAAAAAQQFEGSADFGFP